MPPTLHFLSSAGGVSARVRAIWCASVYSLLPSLRVPSPSSPPFPSCAWDPGRVRGRLVSREAGDAIVYAPRGRTWRESCLLSTAASLSSGSARRPQPTAPTRLRGADVGRLIGDQIKMIRIAGSNLLYRLGAGTASPSWDLYVHCEKMSQSASVSRGSGLCLVCGVFSSLIV